MVPLLTRLDIVAVVLASAVTPVIADSRLTVLAITLALLLASIMAGLVPSGPTIFNV